MKIYTKTGDKGKTSLFDGTRVSKFDDRVEAYGTVDELNSFIGLAYAHMDKRRLVKEQLTEIQHDLFDIGAALANPSAEPISILPNRIIEMERYIDVFTKQMPELKDFILPDGSKGSYIHVCRAICRRAERRVAELKEVDPMILSYLNRLSDALFTLARFINYQEGETETKWEKR